MNVIRMVPEHEPSVADVSSTPKRSLFMIFAVFFFIDLVVLALDNYLRLGLLADVLKWIKENVFF